MWTWTRYNNPWWLVYEGDGDGTQGGGQGGAQGGAAGNQGGAQGGGQGGGGQGGGGTGGQNGGADDDKPTISQKKLNAILAEERKKHTEAIQKQVADLEQLRRSSALTAGEKANLEKRIGELQDSMLTKDELTKKEQDKLLTDHKKQVETLSGEKETWRGRFTDSTISRGITDAAVTGDSFAPSQIVALLKPNARLVEAADADGKPTGEFSIKIKFTGTDKDGKPVQLDLTPEEAIKQMKEMPEHYGNLFKSTMSGGLGGSGGKGGGGRKDQDPSKMTEAEYKEWRKQQGLARTRSGT